jgi:hypothetical protein
MNSSSNSVPLYFLLHRTFGQTENLRGHFLFPLFVITKKKPAATKSTYRFTNIENQSLQNPLLQTPSAHRL